MHRDALVCSYMHTRADAESTSPVYLISLRAPRSYANKDVLSTMEAWNTNQIQTVGMLCTCRSEWVPALAA